MRLAGSHPRATDSLRCSHLWHRRAQRRGWLNVRLVECGALGPFHCASSTSIPARLRRRVSATGGSSRLMGGKSIKPSWPVPPRETSKQHRNLVIPERLYSLSTDWLVLSRRCSPGATVTSQAYKSQRILPLSESTDLLVYQIPADDALARPASPRGHPLTPAPQYRDSSVRSRCIVLNRRQ